jgi:hypothetical protein
VNAIVLKKLNERTEEITKIKAAQTYNQSTIVITNDNSPTSIGPDEKFRYTFSIQVRDPQLVGTEVVICDE